MRVPFIDICVEYMDTHERRVLDLRTDGVAEVPLLGWYSYSHARPDLPVHRHLQTVEICFLERGAQVFEVEGCQYHLRGGDVLVTPPDVPHSTAGQPSEPCVLYWLNVRLPRPGRALLSLGRRDSQPLIDALANLPRLHFRASDLVKPLFDRLLDLHDHPQAPLRSLRMRHGLVELLLAVIDDSHGYSQRNRGTIMGEVLRLIDERANEDIRLEELARLARLSLARFKVRFKQETGVSPRLYILRTRIERAQTLLRGDRAIGDIALDLGFPTSQYFATVFRRFTGVSPRVFRREAVHGTVASHRRDDRQG
jgi:AraC-like DNA-binding protein